MVNKIHKNKKKVEKKKKRKILLATGINFSHLAQRLL